jgi:hypothetical protein
MIIQNFKKRQDERDGENGSVCWNVRTSNFGGFDGGFAYGKKAISYYGIKLTGALHCTASHQVPSTCLETVGITSGRAPHLTSPHLSQAPPPQDAQTLVKII